MDRQLTRFLAARLADLHSATSYARRIYQDRALPDSEDLSQGAILTSIGAILLFNVVLALLSARVRKAVLDTLETIVACILIVVLLGIVLGLPVGACGREKRLPTGDGGGLGGRGARRAQGARRPTAP